MDPLRIVHPASRLALSVAAVVIVTRSPVLFLSFFSGDEATYSALASRILEGFLPYSGAVDHKPPGIELTYALIYAVVGRNRLVAVRIAMMAAVAVTSLLLGLAAEKISGRKEGRLAGILYAAASAWGMPGDMQAANAELFLNLPLAASAWLIAEWCGGGRSLHLAAAGVLTGAAGIYKYQSALAGAAWAAAVFFSRHGLMTRLSGLSYLAAGFLAVAAGFIGFFALTGTWADFAKWGWGFNFRYMSTLPASEIEMNALKYSVLVGFCWLPLLLALKKPGGMVLRLVVPWFASMLLVTGAGGRFFPHYFIMALAPLCVWTALGAEKMGRLRTRASLAAAAALTVASVAFAWLWYEAKPHLKEYDLKYRSVAAYMASRSGPGDRVFVWGNSPEIYYYSDRVMGTRFPFCNYHTGKIWGSRLDDRDATGTEDHIVPGAWELLMKDLTEKPPLFIVDGGAGKLDRYDMHPIGRYAVLERFISEKYAPDGSPSGVPVYRRK